MNAKKCIVLDLDNTLWGGVVGEDGKDNLLLSLTPPGNSFIAFQQALLDHYNRGIILAINSRNNPEDALDVIRTHPNMILKENNFAATRLNWNDKAQNIKELAEELNIGTDSMVFLDDDETNRELVRSLLPEVAVPDLPKDPSEYARFLNSLDYFNKEYITDEDKMRGNLYVTERLRKEEEKNHKNKEDFLNSLGLELSIFEDESSSIARLSQLTEKTNQFNFFKKPLSESEMEFYIADSLHRVFYAKLTDKFGDYGIIALAIVNISDKIWHIHSFLMSCRVFSRNVEDAFLSFIVSKASVSGAEKITVDFEETSKNIPALNFLNKYFNDKEYNFDKIIENPSWIKTIYQKNENI